MSKQYWLATDFYQIQTVCHLGLANRIHAGNRGWMEEWYKTPSNFSLMSMLTDCEKAVAIAGLLAEDLIHDEYVDINVTVFVKYRYRRQGVGTKLLDMIKSETDRRVRGFAGYGLSNTFWIKADADGRDVDSIIKAAEDMGTTPRQLGYCNVPKQRNAK